MQMSYKIQYSAVIFVVKIFFQRPNLISHMKLKHSDGQFRKYECDFDGKIFKSRSEIYMHMNRHLPSVKCKICDAELKIRSVWSHMKEVHSNQTKEICKICDKSFKTLGRLKAHLKVYERKFKCTVCGKRLSNFPSLRDHVRNIHENPGSYSCEICNKKFNRFDNLKVHLKFHDRNRPKPFKCQRCDFATHSKANFNGHQKSHEYKDKQAATMKNPLKCTKCQALLKNKDALRKHMKSVHIEALYQCDLCGLAVKLKSNIFDHIQVHLKNKMKEVK